MYKNYLKIAFRTLRRQKGYAAINVAGLAAGLACSFFILLWVQSELRTDRFLDEGDRIHRVWRNVNAGGEVYTWAGTSRPLAGVLRSEYPAITHAVQLLDQRFVVARGAERFREDGLYAGEAFFDVFAFPFIRGDAQTALADPNAVVITDRLARKLFGDDWQATGSALGQRLTVDQRKDFTVAGVVEDPPAASSLQFDVLLPLQDFAARNAWIDEWGNNFLLLYVKLREGAAPAAVTEQIAGVVNAHEEGADEALFLQPYEDLHLYSEYENGQLVGGRIAYVRLFSAVAVFLLLIAAINFMNLATARSMKRAQEIGVRKAVGASRGALVQQFLGEAVLLALLAFGVALGLTFALLPVFSDLVGVEMTRADLGLRFLLSGLGIALVVGLLAGSYPALHLSSFQPLAVLRGAFRPGSGAAVLRKGLVVFQFGLSTLLIVATAAVYLQIQHIQDRDLGLNREGLIYLPQEGALASQYEAVREDLLGRPGIAGVTASSSNPLDIQNSTGSATWDGKDPDAERETYVLNAAYDFTETMQMELAAGRSFSRAFGADSAGFLINEELAEAMGGGDVVGRRLSFWDETGTVIGVVKDFDMNSLYAPTEPVIIRLAPQQTSRLYVRAAPGQTAEALASLEAVAEAFNPNIPFDYRFVDAEFAETYRSEVIVGRLASVFAVLAVFISCLGLFGLVAYTAEQRTREIGVRKVLGASVPHLVLLLTREVTKLVLLGIALALPVAYVAVRAWLADFEHHIDVGVGLLAAAGAAAVLVAWLTASVQAIRAARMNPTETLRAE